jgi:hypothetical protein
VAASASLAQQVASAYPAMASYADLLVETAGRLNIDPAWLANIIHLESGGNPQARNPTSAATGLIQFMPKTAQGMGTTIDEIYQMNGRQQMPLVEQYFVNIIKRYGPLDSQEKVIAAVFYPAYINKPLAVMSAKVQAQNPGITTIRDYTNKLLKKARLSAEGIGFPTGSTATYAWVTLGVLVAGGGLLYYYKPEAYTRAFWKEKFQR